MNRSKAHDQLCTDIMAAIGSDARVRVWRVESKQARTPGGRPFQAVPPGSPDLAGIVAPWGRVLAIEVKTGGGVANKNQRKRLAMLREFGAVAGVVHSVDQAVAAVAAALHGEWIPGKGLEL